ncbi:MAG TPA: hypothetical protein V6D00_06565 [Pantanalinema sp.]
MPSRTRGTTCLGLVVLALSGCLAAEEDEPLIAVQAIAPGSARSDSGMTGGVAPGTGQGTPSATPTPFEAPRTPEPTPKPAATPLVAIREVSVSRAHLVLFLIPSDPASSLGLPTQHQLSGSATRSDGFPAPIRWLDRSGGQLSVGPTGLVATRPTTVAGDYRVRCVASDDPNVFREVTVEVRSTSALSVIVR